MAKSTWVDDLRGMLKREHGKGWNIEEQSGKVKICRRLPGERKQAVTTHLAWTASSASAVVALAAEVRTKMDELSLGLIDAYRLLAATPVRQLGELDWSEIARRYECHRVDTGQIKQSTFDREERYRVQRAVDLILSSKQAPHNGRQLMVAYTKRHLSDVALGGAGRKRNLLDVSRFLRFSVKMCGASIKWLPPDGEELSNLIGTRQEPTETSVPIKPDQLIGLLDSLSENPELRLAVALVGLYGLRPAELMTLTVVDDQLKVGPVKRNRSTAKKPKQNRLALPLDLKGHVGEGEKVLQLFATGAVRLPTSIRNSKDLKSSGAYFRQYLERHHYWQFLVQASPGLTPYGLRHGYAWRAAKYYERTIPIRDTAALMGHDVRTHMKHYGSWTDDAGLMEVVEIATRSL